MTDKSEGVPSPEEAERKARIITEAVAGMRNRLNADIRLRPKALTTVTREKAAPQTPEPAAVTPDVPVVSNSTPPKAALDAQDSIDAQPVRTARKRANQFPDDQAAAEEAERKAQEEKKKQEKKEEERVAAGAIQKAAEEAAQAQKKQEEERAAAEQAAIAAAVTAASSIVVPGNVEPPKEVKKTQTPETLLLEIPDGTEFVVKSTKGSSKIYKRVGDAFFTTATKPRKADNAVVRLLNHGGTWEKTDGAAAVANSGTLPQGTVVSDVERQAILDGLASLEAKDQKLPPLEDGQEVFYNGANGQVRVERQGEMYKTVRLIQGQGDSGFVFDEQAIRNMAHNEQWALMSGGMPVLSRDNPRWASKENEKKKEKGNSEQYAELFEGDKWVLKKPDGTTEKWIRITALLGYAKNSDGSATSGWVDVERGTGTDDMTSSPGSFLLTDLRSELEENGYILEKEGNKSEKNQPEYKGIKDEANDDFDLVGNLWAAEGATLNETVQEKAPVDPAQEQHNKLDDLRTIVGEMRLQYVTADYKQNSAWARLKKYFNKPLEGGQSDIDTKFAFTEYKRALVELQEAELAELKEQGLSGKPLQEEMGRMLKYYQLDEAVRLFETRNQVKIESKHWQGSIISAAENVGRWYNKLPRWQKYTLAGVCLGAGALGGAAVGGGLVVARRILGSVGLAVTLDAGIEQWQEKKKLAGFEIERGQSLDRLREIQEEGGDLGVVLDGLLKEKLDSLETQFQKQKRTALWRRTAAWGGAGLLVFGGSFVAGQVIGQVKDILHGGGPEPEPSHAITPGPSVTPETPTAGGGVSVGETHPGGSLPAEGVAPNVSHTDILRKDYDVTTADGRGVWGVLAGRLPKGMPKADQNRIIASLENLMRKDLAEMSPSERAAAGFPKGNLDKIYAGKTVIHFDQFKSLTPEQIQAIIDGKSVGAPSLVEPKISLIDGVPKADFPSAVVGPTAMDQAVFDNFIDKVGVDKVGPSIDLERAVAVENYDKLMDTRTFLVEHPDQVPLFNRALGGVRQGIFMMTGERGIPIEYDYTLNSGKLGGATMSQILKDVDGFKQAPFGYSYDRNLNPLHYDQMKALAKLVATVEDPKVFGALGQVRAGENVNDYTKRMAALALQLGKNIPEFFKK